MRLLWAEFPWWKQAKTCYLRITTAVRGKYMRRLHSWLPLLSMQFNTIALSLDASLPLLVDHGPWTVCKHASSSATSPNGALHTKLPKLPCPATACASRLVPPARCPSILSNTAIIPSPDLRALVVSGCSACRLTQRCRPRRVSLQWARLHNLLPQPLGSLSQLQWLQVDRPTKKLPSPAHCL
jgi:hypothetical protein